MKSIKKTKRRAAFTIVELLTVMSIIVILIGLLVPALNQVKRYAYEVKERAQLKSIDTALELFNSEFDGYPDSSAMGPDGVPYCGAMKLCEAVMGQDLLGFHPDSTFRADGTDGVRNLYPSASSLTPEVYKANLRQRKGPYLPLDNANAYSLQDLYGTLGPYKYNHLMLCDVYKRVTHRTIGKKVGMPILYYRANTANTMHDVDNPDNPQNIYNYRDNQQLLMMGMPFNMSNPGGTGTPGTSTPPRLAVETGRPPGFRFYMDTRNEKVLTTPRPYRARTYILISAGWDGEYGTPDDICNYDWRYQETP